MQCVLLNDTKALKASRLLEGNLDFLVEFPQVEIDSRISPLILASYLGRYDIVKLLLEASESSLLTIGGLATRLDVDLGSAESGFTPLIVACKSGNYDIVKMLLDAGAEPNLPNAFNQVPLMMCFSRLEEPTNPFENKKLCFKMADLLVLCGGDVNWIVDKDKGYTLLMQYCSIKMELEERDSQLNLEVITYLLQRGADKTLTSLKKGKTLAKIASKHFNSARVMHLIDTVTPLPAFMERQKPGPYLKPMPPAPAKKDPGSRRDKSKKGLLALFSNICNR
eukprot:TRINITY_DN3674_c0_g1_i3.p1 TRINITY_DN3674_c0_g1~~TRINITY_DN3674_c0_g1_i3.p1  ORF type:complete len:280 (-),score=62.72 TRINITY_DN3674_c0_g1_i3:182-1021(-)